MRNEQPSGLSVYCDFDGTISMVDIGVDFFERFGSTASWLADADAGRMPIRESWRIRLAELRVPLVPAEVEEYLAALPVDPGFDDLLALVRAQAIPFAVVSDGLDLYIRRFLELHGAGDVPIFANHALLGDDGRLTVTFPHADEACCGRFTVSCKRNVLLANTPPDRLLVHIGDGLSDICCADHADVIFAKGRLAAYCNAHRLPHYPFKTLADVSAQLRTLLARRRLRPRHQAVLLRKSAWETE